MSLSSKVNFFSDGIRVNIKNKRQLKGFIELIFRKERKSLGSINYIFCTDAQLLKINRDYLNHDYFTDIVTFDLSDEQKTVTAEVYISVDRVKENAATQKLPFHEELHRVIFHGALHLCGYKDKSFLEKKEIRAAEDRYLKRFFR